MMATPVDIMLWAAAVVAVLAVVVVGGFLVFVVVAFVAATREVLGNRRAKRKDSGRGQ